MSPLRRCLISCRLAGAGGRYVTPGGFRESAMVMGLRGELLESVEKRMRARLALYSPGGQLAVELAKNPTVLVINDTLFAHGGVLPKHGARRRHAPPVQTHSRPFVEGAAFVRAPADAHAPRLPL